MQQPAKEQTTQTPSTSEQEQQPAKEQPSKEEQPVQEKKETPVVNQETQVFTQSVNGISVSVFAPAGTFEQGVEMRVVPVGSQDAMEDAQTVLGKNVDQALSVDISFWKDGVEVEPSQAVTVQLSSDAFAKGEEITVIHDGGQGKVNAVATTTSNNVTISTASFSPYTLATVKKIDTDVLVSSQAASRLAKESVDTASSTEQAPSQNETTDSTTENTSSNDDTTSSNKNTVDTTALSFIQTYLTSPTGVIYSQANDLNAQNILNSKSAWDDLSKEDKISVNGTLNSKVRKTYNKLYIEAQNVNETAGSVHTGASTSLVSYTVMIGTSVLGIISVLKKKED